MARTDVHGVVESPTASESTGSQNRQVTRRPPLQIEAWRLQCAGCPATHDWPGSIADNRSEAEAWGWSFREGVDRCGQCTTVWMLGPKA